MPLNLKTASGGSVIITGANTASDKTITVPAADGNMLYADSSGNAQINSGYGSLATGYVARAWVNFNGTGTVAIRAAGNVSSITDVGTGQYTVNFATAMPDTNYATIGTGYTASTGLPAFSNSTRAIVAFSNTASSCRIQLYRSDTNSFDADSIEMNVAVFR
jgi:hypothetical protein